MPDLRAKLLHKPHLRLIALIGVIVPRRLRSDWRQEWEAELRHRELLLAGWDKLNWQAKFTLFERSLGAFWDALWLQTQRWEDDMFQDLRYGARTLWKKPGFTLVAVFTLALGIGASTAIFSAVNPVLFEPLPYPDPGRLAMLWDIGPEGKHLDVTFGTYRELVERSRSFESIAVMKPWQPTLTGADQPLRLEGQRVSASYFSVLEVSPRLGRTFRETEDEVKGPNVVILSDRLSRRLFGDDRLNVGRQITLNDSLYTVVGVMPPEFENLLDPSAELWAPLQYDKSLAPDSREWGHHLRMIGRLRKGVGDDQARRELDAIAHNPSPEFVRPPHASLDSGLIVTSLQQDLASGVRPALLAVLGAVLVVLAIACVNVTNLLLSRVTQRRGEIAMRAALGATRIRIIRQLLSESLVLAVLGGVLGMAVAEIGLRGLLAFSPPDLPRAGAIHIDAAVFVFALAVTTIVGLAVGLIPALHVSRGDLHVELQRSSHRTTGSHQVTRHGLVVVEVALALVLLVSAGLLMRSLQRLFSVSPGFSASQVLAIQVQVSGRRFDDDDATHRFFEQALDRVRQVPGVSAAALTSQLPLSGGQPDGYGVQSESSPGGRPEEASGAFRYAVSPGYFEAMGIPLRRGRLLEGHDLPGSPLAVVISESLADSKFQGRDPIGQRLRIGPSDGPWYTVVGIVGNVKQTSLTASESDAVYVTPSQWRQFADQAMWLVARASGDAAAIAPVVGQAIWSVDKDQPIVRTAAMQTLVDASQAQRRFAMIVFEAFGIVSLALAATGIYGVLSGSVNERTREIGVRSALGATRGNIVALVLRQGIGLTAAGVAIGLGGAAAASRVLATLLYGTSALDPLTYLAVIAVLLAASGIACSVPAWRAARVDPTVALRHE